MAEFGHPPWEKIESAFQSFSVRRMSASRRANWHLSTLAFVSRLTIRRLATFGRCRSIILPGDNFVLAFNHTWWTLAESFKNKRSRSLAALLVGERRHVDLGDNPRVDDSQTRVGVRRNCSGHSVATILRCALVTHDAKHVLDR
jgi:hypothetical protein